MSKVTLHSVIRALIERDGKRCQICRLPLYLNAPFVGAKRNKRQTHPCAPTVDHIRHVSRGGRRGDFDNLRLTHKLCNHSRNNGSVPKEEHVKKVRRLVTELGLRA